MARTKVRIELSPDATPEERGAYWRSLTKRERMAMLRSGNVLSTSSSEAVAGRTMLRERAKGC